MRFAPGTRLGRFEILSLIGTGGMGEVYRARDTHLDRLVAIKLLAAEVVDAPGRRIERFRHEARAIARITHPNICTLHDVGEDGSAVFLVMELVEGETLSDRLEKGALPLPLALRSAIGIADGLDHAHRNGVVHRDLKPANIMLTRDGVKILDFGLARLTEQDERVLTAPTQSTRLTDIGTILGTVPYMAPEQIEGHEVDGRTDIFSFGVVLYEMVSGQRPFSGGGRASLMAAIVAAEPPALTSLHPQAPVPLQRLILRCLAKKPDDRWQTARDLSAELRWIAETGSGGTAPAATSRIPAAAVWGGLVGAAMAAAVFTGVLPSLGRQPAVAEYRPVTFRQGVVSSARFTPDGRSVVYSASWAGQPYGAFLGRTESADARDLQLPDARILSISSSGDMAVLFGPQNIERAFGLRTMARIPMAGGARRDLLTGVVDADWIPGTDTFAVIRDPGGGRPWTVEFPAGTTVHQAPAAWSLRVSPDGNRVAFFEGPMVFGSAPQASITVVERSGGKSTVARSWTGYGLSWTPSGQEIWFTGTRPDQFAPHVHAVSLSGVERPVHRAPDWLVLHDISADGRVLVSRNTIRIGLACRRPADVRERDLTWMMASSPTGISPGGETVIFADELMAAPSGAPTLFRRGTDGSPAVPIGEGTGGALSPDGKWVLTSSGGNLVLLPTGPGAKVVLPKGDLVRVEPGTWRADSKSIVFTGAASDGKPRGYVQEVPSGPPRPVTPEGVVLAGNAAVQSDESILGRIDGAWALFAIKGGESRPVPSLSPADMPLQWSHGGRFVYAVATVEGARHPAVDVSRVELATGVRTLWKTLMPSDPVGVEDMRETVVITPDAQSYCYSYQRRLGDLYVVNGLE
jgi:eukaryotic-like serine/threonine-protein kinase